RKMTMLEPSLDGEQVTAEIEDGPGSGACAAPNLVGFFSQQIGVLRRERVVVELLNAGGGHDRVPPIRRATRLPRLPRASGTRSSARSLLTSHSRTASTR